MIRHFAARVDVYRNGSRFSELQFHEPPTLYMDATAKIKTSMRGDFKHNPLVDYFRDELVPVIVLDGVEHKLGMYRVGTISARFSIGGAQFDTIEAYDGGLLLTQRKTENILHIAAGANYVTIVEQLITAAGITRQIAIPTTATLQTDREDWPVGTEYIEIINQLLSEINYESLWFNSDGFAMVRPYVLPSAEKIDHNFDGTTELSIVQAECFSETDVFNKPNVFIAVVSNPEMDVMTATAENDNPSSELSITRRGVRIPQVYKVDNIASQNELQAYVNKIRNQSMFKTEIVTIRTAIMPNHGVGDIVALNHPAIQGLFEQTSWYIILEAGQYMTHKLKRVIVT